MPRLRRRRGASVTRVTRTRRPRRGHRLLSTSTACTEWQRSRTLQRDQTRPTGFEVRSSVVRSAAVDRRSGVLRCSQVTSEVLSSGHVRDTVEAIGPTPAAEHGDIRAAPAEWAARAGAGDALAGPPDLRPGAIISRSRPRPDLHAPRGRAVVTSLWARDRGSVVVGTRRSVLPRGRRRLLRLLRFQLVRERLDRPRGQPQPRKSRSPVRMAASRTIGSATVG